MTDRLPGTGGIADFLARWNGSDWGIAGLGCRGPMRRLPFNALQKAHGRRRIPKKLGEAPVILLPISDWRRMALIYEPSRSQSAGDLLDI